MLQINGYQIQPTPMVTPNGQIEAYGLRLVDNTSVRITIEPLSSNSARADVATLQQEIERLTQLNNSKDQLLSIVSHDLKAPFQPLLGLTELLAEMAPFYSADEVQEMAQAVNWSAQQIHTLLENTLTWARLERGKMEYQPSSQPLSGLIEQSMSRLAGLAEQKSIAVHSQIPASLSVVVDETMLANICRQLLSNALKFTAFGGRVVWQAKPSADVDWVEISLSDTGVGISENDLPRLFQLENRLVTIGTDKEQGTGLGLLVARKMLGQHGGEMWLESSIDQGTTVFFTLPFDSTRSVDWAVAGAPISVSPSSVNSSDDAMPDSLMAKISPEQLPSLFEAALIGDMDGVLAWIESYPASDDSLTPLFDYLAGLARNFDEETLLAFLEQYHS